MGDSEEMAPAVASILEAARARGSDRSDDVPGASGDDRDDPSGQERQRVDVDARSLTDAFADAGADGRVPLIAEVKPTSPTTDGERNEDPVALAEGMVAGGAAALSVLTEPEHFGGSTETLARVRDAVDVPVLRKDFVLREAQLDAVAADVVLLIARFLEEPDTGDLAELIAAARDRGFQVLVETHTVAEVERAVEAGADVVGVNNRDLAELEVDLATFERVAPHVPDDVTLIAESGIETTEDVRRMRAAGADAMLVGSAIMAGDVTERTRTLVTAAVGEADEASDAGVAGSTGEAGGEGPKGGADEAGDEDAAGEADAAGGNTDDGPGTE